MTDAFSNSKSIFTLTFVVEILGIEVFHDCNEGWLDLETCSQVMKLQYILYPGQSYDIEIFIWPHAAKVYSGSEYCWVRTWQFLERRFFTFSIRHMFGVKVTELRDFMASLVPSYGLATTGANAKGTEVYLPPLNFGERRYFAPVLEVVEEGESLRKYLWSLIWDSVLEFIPASIMDEIVDTPTVVTDVRHQDAALCHVQQAIMNRKIPGEEDEEYMPKVEEAKKPVKPKGKDREPEKKKSEMKHNKMNKFEFFLSGDTILAGPFNCFGICVACLIVSSEDVKVVEYFAGVCVSLLWESLKVTVNSHFRLGKRVPPKPTLQNKRHLFVSTGAGRIVQFESFGETPVGQGELIVLISSNNLPAQDDLPILFVNVDTLFDAPVQELRKMRITHLYTRWELCDESHDSEHQDIRMGKNKVEVKFNDHHAIPLDPRLGTTATAVFLDGHYEIQLRGIRFPAPINSQPKFFGYEKNDRNYSIAVPPKPIEEELDILIAITKVDARTLAKGINAFIRGDYPLYPPRVSLTPLERESICTNDINAIGAPVVPRLIVPSSLILTSQMTLEVSMGIVGCKPPRLTPSFSRMFCLNSDSDSIMAILHSVISINEELAQEKMNEDFLTGFAIDTGNIVIMYLEGPRDGYILKIWDMTEDFYPKVKPVFSSSARYATRIYPEFLSAVPFVVLKMYVPLGIVLACPPVYARPALPLPTRSAALKIGRLIASKFETTPCRTEMPTAAELKSFRLELCAPPRPPPCFLPDLSTWPDEPAKSVELQQQEKLDDQHSQHQQPKVPKESSMQSTVNWEVRI